MHQRNDGDIAVVRPAGGLVSAIDPVLTACGGTMVAHGSGNADRETVDSHDRVMVPPDHPAYTLRRVWLFDEEIDGYYHGFSNDTLWPLCNHAYMRPQFETSHWEMYQQANRRFAEAVLSEVGADPAVIWVQDYHLTLVPDKLRRERTDLKIAHFWHVPWPNYDNYRICPWRQELLWGLLGSDLVGFHIPQYCQNFLECCDRELEVRVDRERGSVFHHGGIETKVRAMPIGVDAQAIAMAAASASTPSGMAEWRRKLQLQPDTTILLGVDRMDYTKGIPERLRAYGRMLELYPDWKGKVAFVQLGVTSRIQVERYRQLHEEVQTLVQELNSNFGTPDWAPVRLWQESVPLAELIPLYKMAAVCVITSLHDGMNLVAKEFLAAQHDCSGMLVLSQFTGAAYELPEALVVNPFNIDECAHALHQALTMPEDDRALRMEQMRETVMDNNIYRWASRTITELTRR